MKQYILLTILALFAISTYVPIITSLWTNWSPNIEGNKFDFFFGYDPITIFLSSPRIDFKLQYLDVQTEEDCIKSVRQNGFNLQFVRNQTHQICKEAVIQNPKAIVFVEPHFHTEEIALIVVKRKPLLISEVLNRSEKVCIEAVIRDGYAMRFIDEEHQTDAVIKSALTAWRPYMRSYVGDFPLIFVKNKTEEYCDLAVKTFEPNAIYCRHLPKYANYTFSFNFS